MGASWFEAVFCLLVGVDKVGIIMFALIGMTYGWLFDWECSVGGDDVGWEIG